MRGGCLRVEARSRFCLNHLTNCHFVKCFHWGGEVVITEVGESLGCLCWSCISPLAATLWCYIGVAGDVVDDSTPLNPSLGVLGDSIGGQKRTLSSLSDPLDFSQWCLRVVPSGPPQDPPPPSSTGVTGPPPPWQTGQVAGRGTPRRCAHSASPGKQG